MKRTRILILITALAASAAAHVGNHPSPHDAMATLTARIRAEVPADSLTELSGDRIMSLMTDEERHTLATQYWTFTVNVPVTVNLLWFARQGPVPYWFEESGFIKTDLTGDVHGKPVEVWSKDVDAGNVGLGITGFRDQQHYFVVLTPRTEGSAIEVTDMYPGRQKVNVMRPGVMAFSDNPWYEVREIPEGLEGHVLLQPESERSLQTQLVRLFRVTNHPSSEAPDQVALTWSENPQTTQTVQWRTSTAVSDGAVRFREAGGSGDWQTQRATVTVLEDTPLVNDPVVHRYSAVMRGLDAGTTYEYIVGSLEADAWSEPATFTTAPSEPESFSFIYMGDVQNGIDRWRELVQNAHGSHPEARFHVIAGDLVNRGNHRNEWDEFFNSSAGVYNHRPLIPALGNHEYSGPHGPWMYHRVFTLSENGPMRVAPERAYAVQYSNAIFIVLDTNLPVELQTGWLEQQLASTDAVWKFVIYHHPAYSSKPGRNNLDVREQFGGLFDKYHVDMALQGHDHAYLRTYPMRDAEVVDSPAEGTIYVVSVAGSKMYDQGDEYYEEVGYTNLSMYQLLDITIENNRLHYRAFSGDGELRDEFVIEK